MEADVTADMKTETEDTGTRKQKEERSRDRNKRKRDSDWTLENYGDRDSKRLMMLMVIAKKSLEESRKKKKLWLWDRSVTLMGRAQREKEDECLKREDSGDGD